MRLYGSLGDLGDDAGHGELNGRSTRRWHGKGPLVI
jgi:hypothetical protein